MVKTLTHQVQRYKLDTLVVATPNRVLMFTGITSPGFVSSLLMNAWKMSPKSKCTQGLESPTVCEEQESGGWQQRVSESTKQQPDLGMAYSGQRRLLDEEGCKKATVEGRDLKWIGWQRPQSHSGRKRGSLPQGKTFTRNQNSHCCYGGCWAFTESWCHLCTMHGTLVRLHGCGRALGEGQGVWLTCVLVNFWHKNNWLVLSVAHWYTTTKSNLGIVYNTKQNGWQEIGSTWPPVKLSVCWSAPGSATHEILVELCKMTTA